LLATFDARIDAIDACELPMTLVHGDFHRGNLRGDPAHPVLLDWGDCGVGHPLFDVAAMTTPIDAEEARSLMITWEREWRERVPGSDPRRAANLIEPIAALRQAVIYRGFLDRIEPSERCYHAGDPAHWLRRASDALRPSPEG
jgi:aminoglycoside phosphotransferase (APT) family kinase protein